MKFDKMTIWLSTNINYANYSWVIQKRFLKNLIVPIWNTDEYVFLNDYDYMKIYKDNDSKPKLKNKFRIVYSENKLVKHFYIKESFAFGRQIKNVKINRKNKTISKKI